MMNEDNTLFRKEIVRLYLQEKIRTITDSQIVIESE